MERAESAQRTNIGATSRLDISNLNATTPIGRQLSATLKDEHSTSNRKDESGRISATHKSTNS